MDYNEMGEALDNLTLALGAWKESLESPWQRENKEYRSQLARAAAAAIGRVIALAGRET